MNKLTTYIQLSFGIIFFSVLLNTNTEGKSYPDESVTNYKFINSEIDFTLKEQTEKNGYNIETQRIIFPDTPDGQIFQRIVQNAIALQLERTEIGAVIQAVATELLGSQYQAGLLDRAPQETLVISLQKFDCLLFVETVLAIARNITSQDYNYNNFTKNVETQRYSQGKMTDYCSRLHYFSDWINDNEKRNLVTNITSDIGGITIPKKLNFMTNHRNSYAQLVKNETNYQCITAMEKKLEQLTFNYIPTHNIRSIYHRLQPGDVIGIATNIKGLDFTHTGLVYQDERGHIGLIHASPAGRVVIARDLQYYVQNVPNAIGIVVSRPN